MSSRRESDFQRLEKLLNEAEQRAEEERRRAEEERQRAEEAEQRAEEERRRAEEERRRAEEERRRAEEERQRAEEADQRTQGTTFEESLKACHQHLHKALSIETDKRLTTKGFTSPRNKFYPKSLRPWDDFPEIQQRFFDDAYGFFHPPDLPAPRHFNPLLYFEGLGRDLRLHKLASEADLESYERTALENMVARIITHLCEMELARARFNLGQGITFENHINSLNDIAEEVQQHLRIRTPRASPHPSRSSSSSGSESDSKPTQTRADQFCVYKNVDDIRKLLFLVEYKPPHKLSIGNLQAGFRPMNLEDMLTAATIPNELEARLQYNADKLAAAVATQTFHYMIENGLEYSYLTTGEAFVFLQVKEEDPTTLYYHLTVPGHEIDDEELESLFPQTAISQVMSLCLMAFQSEQRNHRWRRNAQKGLKKHKLDYEAILRQIPETERKLSPVSIHKGRKNPNPKESPYFTRLRSKKEKEKAKAKAKTSCDSDKPRFGDDGYEDPDTPSKPGRGRPHAGNQTKGKGNGTAGEGNNNTNSRSGSKGRQRQYCTQGCLLGIVRGMALDERCPNVSLHRRHGNRHAINMREFKKLVRRQLQEDLDNDCEPLGSQGARGALFKLTLASHGYVFVGKGTVKAFVRTLLHEGGVYQRLENLQGTAVPVYLGNIDLVEWYYLDVGVRILHMLLMSWGGDMVEGTTDSEEIRRTVREVRSEGVDQGDVRTANLLWNEERKRVMLIDFERAIYIDHDRSRVTAAKDERALQEVSPNKKRKRVMSSKLNSASDR